MTVKLKEIDQAHSLTSLSSRRGLQMGEKLVCRISRNRGFLQSQCADRSNNPKRQLIWLNPLAQSQ